MQREPRNATPQDETPPRRRPSVSLPTPARVLRASSSRDRGLDARQGRVRNKNRLRSHDCLPVLERRRRQALGQVGRRRGLRLGDGGAGRSRRGINHQLDPRLAPVLGLVLLQRRAGHRFLRGKESSFRRGSNLSRERRLTFNGGRLLGTLVESGHALSCRAARREANREAELYHRVNKTYNSSSFPLLSSLANSWSVLYLASAATIVRLR